MVDATVGWELGDALGSAATVEDVSRMVELCRDTRYGIARQMIVLALGRFSKSVSYDAGLGQR